jgi:hypothetical protein
VNKKGDEITIFGTATFRKESGKWVVAAPQFKGVKTHPSQKIHLSKKYVSEI